MAHEAIISSKWKDVKISLGWKVIVHYVVFVGLSVLKHIYHVSNVHMGYIAAILLIH